MKKSVSTRKVWLEAHGHYAHFTHRDQMRRKAPMARATLPEHLKAVPPTTLPVDCTGNGSCSWPMDDNDKLGICGLAMADHVDGTRTFGQGKTGFSEVHANLAALDAQYEQVSGGDNGTDEDMLVGESGVWTAASGGLAGDKMCVVVDHLDVDITDAPLTQYCHDQFYATCMAWSVPDAFLQGFATGTSWLSAMTPNPANGHFTPMSDVDKDGNYRLITWGGWCWVSPSFVASVQPQCFVTFSPLQFNKATGYDSHGRHVSEQASKWVALGGDAAKVAAVVAMFPAIAPTPAPAPSPTPPSGLLTSDQVTAVQGAVSAVIDPCDALIEKAAVAPALQAAVAALGPAS